MKVPKWIAESVLLFVLLGIVLWVAYRGDHPQMFMLSLLLLTLWRRDLKEIAG